MEKRFAAFIFLSMLILIGYQAIEMRLNPPPEVQELADAGDATDDDAEAEADDSTPDDASSDGTAGSSDAEQAEDASADQSDSSDEGTADADSAEDDLASATEPDTPTVVPSQWSTLGSMNPGDRMLVFFNNEGASIACIALNDPRFKHLSDRKGYLGFLGLENHPQGCLVRVVGPGTSAAKAGVQPGDILVQGDEVKITDLIAYEEWRETTTIGQASQITVLRNETEVKLDVTLDRRPLEIIHPTPDDTVDSATSSYLLSLAQLGEKKLQFGERELTGLPSLRSANWEVSQPDAETVEFSFLLSKQQLASFGKFGPLRIIKRFRLAPPVDADNADLGYHLDYQIAFRNEGSESPIAIAYQQEGPTGLPLEGWWYTSKLHPTSFGGAGMRDIVSKAFDGPHKMFTNPKIIERLEENPENPMTPMYEGPTPLHYVGVDAQYFNSALVADTEKGEAPPNWFTFAKVEAVPIGPKNEERANRTDVTFQVTSPPHAIAPGGEFEQSFKIFAGPKKPAALAPYGMNECITYGWFRVVAQPLQFVLHLFHRVVRNYGVAIILLTMLVRGSMLPIGRQQAMNARKMQELAPDMRKIADKYKDNMEKRAAAQRELFAKHNYNPLAGCLPLFIQMPIFIGLYRALSVDIELRQAALIPGIRWCSNLAGPDQLLNWSGFMPSFLASKTGFLGPYLNILPLISVVLMIFHQRLFTPPATDEQQEMQQKMMKFMMIFMAFIFFKFPAGLSLYFITSSAWALGERLLLPKPPAPAGQTDAAATVVSRKPSNNGKASTKKQKNRSKSKRR